MPFRHARRLRQHQRQVAGKIALAGFFGRRNLDIGTDIGRQLPRLLQRLYGLRDQIGDVLLQELKFRVRVGKKVIAHFTRADAPGPAIIG